MAIMAASSRKEVNIALCWETAGSIGQPHVSWADTHPIVFEVGIFPDPASRALLPHIAHGLGPGPGFPG